MYLHLKYFTTLWGGGGGWGGNAMIFLFAVEQNTLILKTHILRTCSLIVCNTVFGNTNELCPCTIYYHGKETIVPFDSANSFSDEVLNTYL